MSCRSRSSYISFFLMIRRPPRSTRTAHSFPTRRSSDLHTDRSASSAGAQPGVRAAKAGARRSEEHTSELQSLMRISYAVFCLKKQTNNNTYNKINNTKLSEQYSTTPMLQLITNDCNPTITHIQHSTIR